MKPFLTLVAATLASITAFAADAQGSRARPAAPSAPRTTGGSRPPLVGTLSPRAFGRPAPTPTPIGGLQTRPLNSQRLDSPRPVGADPSRFRDRDRDRDRDRRGDGYNGQDGYRDRDRFRDDNRYPDRRRVPDAYGRYYPFGVGDAPMVRGGGIAIRMNPGAFNDHDRTGAYNLRTWYPAPVKPRWRLDSRLSPVQAWRDLIVTDVICDGAGTCMEREQRVRAPWVAPCRCYMFTDALGRRWEIE